MKYKHITSEEAYEGMVCEKVIIKQYDSHTLWVSPEVAANHWLNDLPYKPYILTKKDVEGLKLFTGDLRNSPGIPNIMFRISVTEVL